MAVDQSLVVFGNHGQIPIYKKNALFSIEKLGKIYLLLEFSSKKAKNWYRVSLQYVLKTLCGNFENFEFSPKSGGPKSTFSNFWCFLAFEPRYFHKKSKFSKFLHNVFRTYYKDTLYQFSAFFDENSRRRQIFSEISGNAFKVQSLWSNPYVLENSKLNISKTEKDFLIP